MTPDRIEQAGAGEQRELLIEVFHTVFPHPESPMLNRANLNEWGRLHTLFSKMLDAEAYLDAAMMLKGDLRLLCLTELDDGEWAAKLWKQPACAGATPALALLSAILRAGESA